MRQTDAEGVEGLENRVEPGRGVAVSRAPVKAGAKALRANARMMSPLMFSASTFGMMVMALVTPRTPSNRTMSCSAACR